jgi:iron complex outermembrane receptor protein
VLWNLHWPVLEDIQQIEVISGPGGTLYGPNAVNGVINVTSKTARDTQGWLFDGTYGSVEQRGAVRYGGKLDDNTFYRVWGQFHTTDDFPTPGDDERLHASHDGWDALSSGFRLDRFSGADDTFTVIANALSIREGKTTQLLLTQAPYTQNLPLTTTDDDFNLLGRWTHVIGDRSDFSVQAYYDHLDHAVVQNKYALDTGDIEFQHRFPIGSRQELIWGAGYRFMADGVSQGPRAVINPAHRDDYIADAFVQDDVTVVKDRLHLIVGTKLEENSFSGFEVQPSARVLWTPSERQTVWAAVSRAVRTPSRYEQDATVQATSVPVPPTGIAALATTIPNPGFQSESEVAYELGHRIQATKSLSFDTALFFNQYDKLRTFDFGNPALVGTAMPPFLAVPVTFGNNLTANAYGGEVAVNWRVTDHWRVSGSYSLCIIDARLRHPGTDPTGVAQLEGTTPRNQAQLHSYFDLSRHWTFDASAYYAESMPYLKVPSNLRVDLALTWAPKDNLSVTFGVQNLLDRWHPEFGGITSDVQRTEVPRTIFAQMVYRF